MVIRPQGLPEPNSSVGQCRIRGRAAIRAKHVIGGPLERQEKRGSHGLRMGLCGRTIAVCPKHCRCEPKLGTLPFGLGVTSPLFAAVARRPNTGRPHGRAVPSDATGAPKVPRPLAIRGPAQALEPGRSLALLRRRLALEQDFGSSRYSGGKAYSKSLSAKASVSARPSISSGVTSDSGPSKLWPR